MKWDMKELMHKALEIDLAKFNAAFEKQNTPTS
jgi:hypothetical protein